MAWILQVLLLKFRLKNAVPADFRYSFLLDNIKKIHRRFFILKFIQKLLLEFLQRFIQVFPHTYILRG